LSGSDDDRGEACGTSLEEALARVVVDHQLDDRLGHPIGRLRGAFGEVADPVGHIGASVGGDAAGEDDAGQSFALAQGFEQVTASVEVRADRFVEVLLAFSADHRGEVEDGEVVAVDRGEDGVAVAHVGFQKGQVDRSPPVGRHGLDGRRELGV
jgi:hypothetical protein